MKLFVKHLIFDVHDGNEANTRAYMNFCNRVLQGRKASPMQECKSFSLVEVEKFMTLEHSFLIGLVF